MKSYNNLWDNFISYDNILLAIKNSSQGKRKRPKVKKIFDCPEENFSWIQEYAENFENDPHIPKEIYDGIVRKKRVIIVPTYREQIIHHMCVNILIPIFEHGMYEHSYASLPNRGAHKAKKHIEKWIKYDPENTKYFLKIDIKKYFDSIPHDILKKKLSKKIRDKKFLKVLFAILDVTEKGIPLGFYTSQWLANWYLQDLDHFIKEQLHAKYYVRYMDDMVIFGSNSHDLHDMRIKIESYLKENLGLTMKENWNVAQISEVGCLDFMGFRFFRNRTSLRRTIFLKAKRKAARLEKKDFPSIFDCRQMMAYLGWFDATDTYDAFEHHIASKITIQKLKRKVAKYDRRKNYELEKCNEPRKASRN